MPLHTLLSLTLFSLIPLSLQYLNSDYRASNMWTVDHTLLGGLVYRAMVGTAMAFWSLLWLFCFFFFNLCWVSDNHTHKASHQNPILKNTQLVFAFKDMKTHTQITGFKFLFSTITKNQRSFR